MEEGRFREDLDYRLHVIPIHLPPLREREDDVLEIARHYLAEFAAEEKKGFTHFSPETEHALRHYHWPGNVRQLQNVVRIVAVLHDGDTVRLDMLPSPLGNMSSVGHTASLAAIPAEPAPPPPRLPQPLTPDAIKPLWEVEKDAIEDAITACDGNIPRAAALLQISASTIYRKRLAWQAEGKL